MRQLPSSHDSKLLVGAATADDAGVYQIDSQRALVQTVDFFTPIVDDPVVYGRIAATNALSDVYAMGGRPLVAMNILGFPEEKVPPEMVAQILRGGALQTRKAKCPIVGGHTIQCAEPFYGLAVTGVVHPKRVITNAQARPGDILIITKPLGTGIITTGIKRAGASAAALRAALRSMTTLNTVGAVVGEAGLVRAGTDITGFGLLGHLSSMCKASGVGARLRASELPVLHKEVRELIRRGFVPGGTRENLARAQEFVEFGNVSPTEQIIAADAQTSGGLLLCVPEKNLARTLKLLKDGRTLCAAVIGQITNGKRIRFTAD